MNMEKLKKKIESTKSTYIDAEITSPTFLYTSLVHNAHFQ